MLIKSFNLHCEKWNKHSRMVVSILVTGIALVSGLFLPISSAYSQVEENVPLQAENLVNWGLVGYYKVYGEFPQRWSQVVNAQIVQLPLYVPAGGAVNPDDGQLDFPGDVVYLGPTGNGNCALETILVYGTGSHRVEIAPVRTYAELLPVLSERSQMYGGELDYGQVLNDDRWLRLFAMAGVLDHSLSNYCIATQSVTPPTLDAFFTSGFAPINRSSINPVTNMPFAYDGRAEDIWVYIPEELGVDGNLEERLVPTVEVVSSAGYKYGIGMY